ncbi:MAG TPA: NAD-dependent epimerase/dehydratase family protein [Vicinamibacterales bacterium]|nr:NAD-dependent epimerase/dehydratase family protein [Vicinamibacterales bacterium]
MRVLVTGGTGYLGSAIVRALAKAGHDPVVFSRHAAASEWTGARVDGDVRDTAAVARAAAGADAICHAAALVAIWRQDPSEFDAINVGGLQSVLAAARTAHVPRIVYTSSFLALPPRDRPQALTANHYQRTKVIARDVARRAIADGLPLIALYPGVIYGPGPVTEGNLIGRLLRDHLVGRLPGVIGADRPWSYAFVEDVAKAHVQAIAAGRLGAEYVVGGVNAPQMTVFEHLRRVRGTPLPRRIPYALATAAAALEELKAAVLRRPPTLTRGTVDIFRHDWSLDSGRAIADLDYRITPLEEGLERTIAGL